MTSNRSSLRAAQPPELGLHERFAPDLDTWGAREREAEQRQERRLPAATVAELRRSGILAAPIPLALGGGGVDLFTSAALLRRVAAHAPSTALCLAMSIANAANTRIGDEAVSATARPILDQTRRWIAEKVLSGTILAVANSEPGAGGDLFATKTRALRDAAGNIRLRGRKSFATFGPDADYFLCSACHEHGMLDAFFVARTAPGVSVGDDWDGLGMRTTASVSLSLYDAPVETVFMYPGAITGANARHWSTLLLASVFVGVGDGALRAATDCAPSTSAWARSTLAEVALGLEAAGAFIEALAREDAIPCGSAYLERCLRAKTFAARAALDTASRAVSVSGGRAYRPQHAVARFLLDAAAGPLLRPPMPQAMDAIAAQLFTR